MDTNVEKKRENRVRRMAQRQGLHVVKSRRRETRRTEGDRTLNRMQRMIDSLAQMGMNWSTDPQEWDEMAKRAGPRFTDCGVDMLPWRLGTLAERY